MGNACAKNHNKFQKFKGLQKIIKTPFSARKQLRLRVEMETDRKKEEQKLIEISESPEYKAENREDGVEEEPDKANRLSKIDEAINSIYIARKKQENQLDSEKDERRLTIQQGREMKDRLTIELKEQPFEYESTFRQRIITAHQLVRDNSYTKIHINERKLHLEILTLKTEEEPSVPNMNISIQKEINKTNQNIILLNGQKSIHFEILYKSTQDCIFFEQRTMQFQNQELITREGFLKNIQLTDNYLNQEGLFYVLKQGMKSKGISLIIDQIETKSQTKNAQIIFTKNNLDLSNLCFLANRYSHFQFQILFNNNSQVNFENFKKNYSLLTRFKDLILGPINDTLNQMKLESNILWIRMRNHNDQAFSLYFMLPEFLDVQKDKFKMVLYNLLKKKFNNIRDVQVAPLFKFLVASKDILDPWRNIQQKKKISPSREQLKQFQNLPYGWRLFAIKQNNYSNILEENTSPDRFGYVNIFYQYENLRQCPSVLNLKNEDVIIIKNFLMFKMTNQYKFIQPKQIEFSVYGEKKSYQILLKVEFNPNEVRTINTQDPILDSNILIASNVESLKFLAFLVLDNIFKQDDTNISK